MYPNQTCPFISTNTALGKVTRGCMGAKCNGPILVPTSLGFSAANDMVGHSLVLKTLSSLGFQDSTHF